MKNKLNLKKVEYPLLEEYSKRFDWNGAILAFVLVALLLAVLIFG